MGDARAAADFMRAESEPAVETTLGELKSARFSIRTICEARRLAGFLTSVCPQLSIASIGLMELLINSIEHGNLGIDFDAKTALLAAGGWTEEVDRRLALPEYRDRRIVVDFAQGPEGVRISIQDEGDGFDPSPYLNDEVAVTDHSHGRGIFLARHTGFASIEYQDGGRRVVVNLDP